MVVVNMMSYIVISDIHLLLHCLDHVGVRYWSTMVLWV